MRTLDELAGAVGISKSNILKNNRVKQNRFKKAHSYYVSEEFFNEFVNEINERRNIKKPDWIGRDANT